VTKDKFRALLLRQIPGQSPGATLMGSVAGTRKQELLEEALKMGLRVHKSRLKGDLLLATREHLTKEV
jgi:hypothetical protein